MLLFRDFGSKSPASALDAGLLVSRLGGGLRVFQKPGLEEKAGLRLQSISVNGDWVYAPHR
jgi:hypothetical protein